eukprot:CAMPEP_0202479214 /NCGR_PEP_ID=MMETSP1360-20130828/94864_1 /ASSEMBLY_ACC=CAM_ASM_000848 /TAXON_ID=515479 /ORGANISM="Licmophora paradoxa, Strain CCMP2313" /LENGTH=79 /DNA_ID=CAMNT_0049106527 /DNA_START=405 /DNA_END=644 /DNA_ORIENTATION=+
MTPSSSIITADLSLYTLWKPSPLTKPFKPNTHSRPTHDPLVSTSYTIMLTMDDLLTMPSSNIVNNKNKASPAVGQCPLW